MFSDVIKGQFPITTVVLPPVGGHVSKLLAARVQLTAIDKICGEQNGKSEASLLLGEIGEVQVLMETTSHIT